MYYLVQPISISYKIAVTEYYLMMKFVENISLQLRLGLLIGVLVMLQVAIVGGYSTRLIANILSTQLGERVLNISETVARIPLVRESVEAAESTEMLRLLIESIRQETGAEFIVVGDKSGIRLTHPNNLEVGFPMTGGDNDPVLVGGSSIISHAVGSLGPSVRGKVPIFGETGFVVGVVSVGFLESNLSSIISRYQRMVILVMLPLILIGIGAAIWVAMSLKRALFGLEPAEIAKMFEERSAILESVIEGIIAIDKNGRITVVNHAAADILGSGDVSALVGQDIFEVSPNSRLMSVLRSGRSELNSEHILGGQEVIANRVPIIHDGKVEGVVSSFRRKDEIDRLAQELSNVREFADLLQEQTHEYSNKLHTISGLISLGAYEEAVALIGDESSGYQDLIQFLIDAIPDPIISGVVMGKYNLARRLKIRFDIDRDSRISQLPEHISGDRLVKIMGNLLDNAFAAVAASKNQDKNVYLSLSDLGNDLIIEVEDSGDGVPEEIANMIFDKGFSTSNEYGRGLGLHLVSIALDQLDGHMTLGSSEHGGSIFTVYIPINGVNDG